LDLRLVVRPGLNKRCEVRDLLCGFSVPLVTRVVYIREIADARRRHMRRSRMTAEYAGALRIALADDGT
jgi:hypothetical protein